MKIARLVALATLLCIAGQAHAQMNTHYDVYATESTDGTKIYTSVLTEGYSDGNGPGIPATHTPSSYNVVGGVGGWGYGARKCWDCYIGYQNDQSIDAQPTLEYEFDSSGGVNCSAISDAIFFKDLGPTFLSIHRTTYRYVSINPATNVCTYEVYCITTPHICGADTTTVQGPCPYAYFITVWLQVRVGMISTCFPGPAGVLSNTWLSCF
jgi:hypothetical protein